MDLNGAADCRSCAMMRECLAQFLGPTSGSWIPGAMTTPPHGALCSDFSSALFVGMARSQGDAPRGGGQRPDSFTAGTASTGIAVDIMTDRSCIPAIAKWRTAPDCGQIRKAHD